MAATAPEDYTNSDASYADKWQDAKALLSLHAAEAPDQTR